MAANVFEKHPLTAASGVGAAGVGGEGATDVNSIIGAVAGGGASASGGGVSGGAGIAGLVLPIAGLITNLIISESNPPPKTLSEKERGLYEHLKNLGYDVTFEGGHLGRHPHGSTWGRPAIGGLFWNQLEQPYEAGTAVPASESISGPYTQASGALAGALLKRNKIKPSHLVLGGTEKVLSALVGSLFSGGGF